MQQNQPQPEFSQDHIVRRLISKFRKPSDAGTIGLAGSAGTSNTLQVPAVTHGGPASVPTISGLLGDSSSATGGGGTSGTGELAMAASSTGLPGIQRSLAGKQSRWSQLVASAAAGAASKSGATGSSGGAPKSGAGGSSTRSLLDIQRSDGTGESSSNRSSADGRDDEVDENYFRPGGKGHQALLDNMDKR